MQLTQKRISDLSISFFYNSRKFYFYFFVHKMKPCNHIVFCAIGIILSLNCMGQQVKNQSSTLSVGDEAPGFKVEKWIRYGGTLPFEKGKVYLVDLWATWCAPCIAGMPHLTQLQKKYKANGLEVIGITSEDKYGNTLENVINFVSKRDTTMNYNVAWVPASLMDTVEGIWLHPWMIKSGSGNLPTAFLVDKHGKIVFIGDPFTIDSTLYHVMNDHYDIDRLKANYLSGINAEKVLSQFNSAIKTGSLKEAIVFGRQILNGFSYVKPNTYLIMGWQVSHVQGEIHPELLEIAYDAIIRGIKLTEFNSPAFFDVLAGIFAAKKDIPSAVIAEKLAVSLSEGEMKKTQSKNLEKYLSMALKNE